MFVGVWNQATSVYRCCGQLVLRLWFSEAMNVKEILGGPRFYICSKHVMLCAQSLGYGKQSVSDKLVAVFVTLEGHIGNTQRGRDG